MDRVLIVDDDVELCELLSERLSTEGFAIETVQDGPHGLERALSQEHALVVLDLMLPGMGGLDLLRRLRARSPVPVLILTARGDDIERILGLEVGADDYLPKPFNARELIARIRAILRRTHRVNAAADPLIVGDIRLDPARHEARLQSSLLNLTTVEFTLLEMLLLHAGHVVTREQLTETVLGRKLGPFDRVIDVHISNIRKKLGSNHGGERIKAVRGSGYLLVARSEAE
ncbi:response regulator transcription factor [Alloacidobacterium dinghuense]|uniref:Response regulator transcription factor n=1 Tax=Alloacidobacterium dinghuense TaxID=2763107 RepID=A0A7G8BJK2_9BACT|nr:response regulator transcription factor [Alloacidobacterium dinghuense]QNI32722.1 response regulator transcription factor [Alloacidobacterium dinghuense]